MKTGFTELDELITLDEGKLIILASDSKMGKSILGLNIASYIAFKENMPILYFYMENSKEEILKMILSAESMVKKNKLEHGKADDIEWQRLKEGMKALSESEIIINDTPAIDIEEICSRSRKLVKEKGVKFILIDYIQLISCNTDENLSKEDILSKVSIRLKCLARELDIPILAISKLPKEVEERKDYRPRLNDLRGSGALEQDADIVLMLYREEYYNEITEKKGIAEILVVKNRNGKTGVVELLALFDYCKFANIYIGEKENEKNRSVDGIIGFAIGDAFGVPYEFKTRGQMNSISNIEEMIGYGTYNVPKGTWSDDTSMTLATMDSIAEKGKIDTEDIAKKFIKWFRNSEYTATGNTFDIGRTTFQSLAQYELKLDKAINCGQTGEMDNGNGSLMRMLPIAYYIYYKGIKDSREIYEIVKDVSSITHAHEISILGCYIYVNLVIYLLNGEKSAEAHKKLKEADYSFFSKSSLEKYSRILKGRIEDLKFQELNSSGYIVDTLESVLWLFFNSNNYNQTIIRAVSLGEDTDTIAACAGGLVGIYYGIESINENWKKDLKRYDYIRDLCEKFDSIIADFSKRLENINQEEWSDEDVFERYIVYGDNDELKKSDVQKLLIKHGYIEEVTQFVDSVITDDEVINSILNSHLFEDGEINLRKGRIEKIEFVEDDELPEEFNWCYITFIENNSLEILTILDFCYIPENEEYEEELNKYKDNIGIVTEIINDIVRVRCFLKSND